VRWAAVEQAPIGDQDLLLEEWDESAVEDELSYLDHDRVPVPKSLNACNRALVRRAQLESLREELPVVARTVLADVNDGGFPVPARHWASRVEKDEDLSARKAVELFLADQIGRERIVDEVGSNLFTRVATKALATATTAMRGRHSGLLGPLKTAATFARGIALATYLLGRGAVAQSKTGAAIVTLVLAIAGTIIAIPLATGTGSWGGLTTLAAIVLVGGFILALVRSGWVILAILAVAIAVGATLALTVLGDDGDSAWQRLFGWVPDVAPAIPVAVVVAIAILFGLVRKPHWARSSGRRRSSPLDMPGIWGPRDP
jgi:hypothetical protein